MSSTQPVEQDPTATVFGLLGGFQASQAVYVFAKRGVATILEQEGPTTVTELAARTDSDVEALGRLLRTLAPLGLVSADGDRVVVTEAGALLSEKHPRSLHRYGRMWMETIYPSFAELDRSVATGTPGADHHLGQPFFEWIAADADRETLFSGAMADATVGLRAGMFDGYALPPGATVADLGASDGSMLVELLGHDADTNRRGIVFDRPGTVEKAASTVAAAGMSDRVTLVAGDFLEQVPAAEVYVLGWILHDHSDEDCLRLLRSISAAAAPGARLVIVESLVPPGDGPHLTKVLDLTMMVLFAGKERTEQEMRDLLDEGGFTVDRTLSTSTPFSIIEVTLR